MNRSPEAEARRKVNQSKTWYSRLVEKNRQAEAEYREKIAEQERQWQGIHDRMDRLTDKLEVAAQK